MGENSKWQTLSAVFDNQMTDCGESEGDKVKWPCSYWAKKMMRMPITVMLVSVTINNKLNCPFHLTPYFSTYYRTVQIKFQITQNVPLQPIDEHVHILGYMQ